MFKMTPEAMALMMGGVNMMAASRGGNTDMTKGGLGYALQQGMTGAVQGAQLGQGIQDANQKRLSAQETAKAQADYINSLPPEQQPKARMLLMTDPKAFATMAAAPKPAGPFEGNSIDAQILNMISNNNPQLTPYSIAANHYNREQIYNTPTGQQIIRRELPPGAKNPNNLLPSAASPLTGQSNTSVLPNTEKTHPEQLKYNEQWGSIEDIVKSMNSFGGALKKSGIQPGVGPVGLDVATRSDLQSKYKAVQLAFKNAFELGVLSKDDAKILEEFISDPTGPNSALLGNDGVNASYNSAIDYLHNKLSTFDQKWSDTQAKSKPFSQFNRMESREAERKMRRVERGPNGELIWSKQ